LVPSARNANTWSIGRLTSVVALKLLLMRPILSGLAAVDAAAGEAAV
jgi:hypothetical protein